MNALRAVPDPSEHAPVTEAPVDDPIDLTDDPRNDPEALVLCALMWTTDTAEARRIAEALHPEDFTAAGHLQLFPVIRDLVLAGDPHDPASVLGALRRGDITASREFDEARIERGGAYIPTTGGDGRRGEGLRRILTDVTTAGAAGAAATHYADLVLAESYRRSFHLTGQRLIQAAEEGPEDDLFDYMVQLGTAQRAFRNRLDAFRTGTNQTAEEGQS